MDISSLYNVGSGAVSSALDTANTTSKTNERGNDVFASFLNSAVDNIKTTNSYLSDAENEEIKLSMGESQNTHDLTIALQKASTALQYTVAVRDRFLEAYKEIMNMQI